MDSETENMYSLIIRALEHYSNSITKLDQVLNEKCDFSSSLLKMAKDDLSIINDRHVKDIIKILPDYMSTARKQTEIPAILENDKDLISASIKLYLSKLNEIKAKISDDLSYPKIELKCLDKEISLAEKAKEEYC